MKFYSQYGQDKWLYENLFKSINDGTFIEVGADDGVDKSNTLVFENLGWTGICIEPSPERFKLLQSNRKCECLNVAIANKETVVDFLDIRGWGKGLSGIIDSYSKQHNARIKHEMGHKDNKGHNIIKVETKKLSNILEDHKINKIDFCSIDVEGSELDVLKSIDLYKTNISVIMIENNYNDRSAGDYLINEGYELLKKIEIDDIYVKT